MLLAASTAEARSLLIAAAVSLAGWFVLLELLALASRPRKPAAGPAAMIEVGNAAEPPAIVNYLVNACATTDAGVAATLLDLAAHDFLTIDEIGPDQFVCRLRANFPADSLPASKELRPYEKAVLSHVRSLAVDGVLPCAALTTGTQGEATAWRQAFDKAVAKDARDRGLARGRWSTWATVLLGVTALVPAGFLVAALAATPQKTSSSGHHGNNAGGYFFVGLISWAVIMAALSLYRADRETPAGRAVWARWLGLRDYLRRDENFASAPPAAVAIWDRYLAYGAALGVAHAAVRALPFGAGSDKAAWSAYGGKWRLVHIRYPHAIRRPGWGWHPAKAILLSLLLAVPAGGAVRLVQSAGRHHVLNPSSWSSQVRLISSVATTVLAVLAAYLLITWIRIFVGGVGDLFMRSTVTGQVLRARACGNRHFLALDDGHHDHVQAWNVRQPLYATCYEGQVLTATIGGANAFVYRLVPVPAEAAPAKPAVQAAPQPAAPPVGNPTST